MEIQSPVFVVKCFLEFFTFTKQSLLEQRQYLIPMFIGTPWSVDIKKERKKERRYKTGRKLKDTWPPTPFQEKEKILFSFFKHYFLFVFDDMEGFEMEPCVTDLGNYQFYKKDWINFEKTSLKSHPLMVTLSSTLKINNLKNCVNWTIDRVYKKNC